MNLLPRLLVASLPLLVACYATSQGEQAGVPALLEPGMESPADIEQAVANLVQQQDVALAGDVFTASSLLVLERSQHSGREMGRPEQIQLMLDAQGCYLLRTSTAQTARLAKVRCRAEAP